MKLEPANSDEEPEAEAAAEAAAPVAVADTAAVAVVEPTPLVKAPATPSAPDLLAHARSQLLRPKLAALPWHIAKFTDTPVILWAQFVSDKDNAACAGTPSASAASGTGGSAGSLGSGIGQWWQPSHWHWHWLGWPHWQPQPDTTEQSHWQWQWPWQPY